MCHADAAPRADLLLEGQHHVDDRLHAGLVGPFGRVDAQACFLGAAGVEDDAFNFRATKVDADAHAA